MEKKHKIKFPEVKEVSVTLGDVQVSVKPFLDTESQRILAEVYMREFFSLEDPMRVFNAERGLLIGLLEYNTDLKLFDGSKPLFELDDVYRNTEFVEKVRRSIKNYNEFRAILRMSLDEINREHELNESIGRSLKVFVAQVSNFLTDFDASPEKIEEMKALIKEANNSEILQTLVAKIK